MGVGVSRAGAVKGNDNTFCPRRATENGNCNIFCPRRATEDHGERQLQHLLSAKGREGSRRTATATPFCPRRTRRDTENGNCNIFCPRRGAKGREELQLQHLLCPRRATEDHGERQLQHLLSAKGHGGPRRTATATSFVREGTRRVAKNCNCNTFLSTKDTEGHGERQLQHLLSAKGREGSRRTATATPFLSAEDAEGRGERQLQHLLSAKGREGSRRTATATAIPFVHGEL